MASKRTFRIRSRFRPDLVELGYRDFEDFFSPSDSEIASEVRDRIVYRIPDDSGRGNPGYYLKVFQNSGANRPWRQLALFEKPRSCAETEVNRLDWLEEHGFLGPRWAAWGAEMRGFSEVRSFLMTEALHGRQGLDEWLSAARENLTPSVFRGQKRIFLANAARTLAKLHEEGFHHPYPYLRHFCVPQFQSEHEGEPDETVAVIDVHSAEIGGPVSRRKRARGLAELLVSSLKAPLTHSDRIYFLREYGSGALDRQLARAVLERFEEKLRRHPNRYAWAREIWKGMRFPRSNRLA
jgi:hypothetical protein